MQNEANKDNGTYKLTPCLLAENFYVNNDQECLIRHILKVINTESSEAHASGSHDAAWTHRVGF